METRANSSSAAMGNSETKRVTQSKESAVKKEPIKSQRVICKISMDQVMDKINSPFKKIKENLYLLPVNTREEIEGIVNQIQNITRVTWSVKQTRKFDIQSNRTLTLFKRNYGCHMATRRRTKTKNIKQKKSRNIDCPAQLIVTIRKFIANSKSKQRAPLLDEDFPCSFEFRNDHNHRIDAIDVLKTRPLGEETKQDILRLLNKGHTCASAYHTYYTIKVEEFGREYKAKMDDRHYFPKKNDVSTLWKMHNFREKVEQFENDINHITNNLEEILLSYQKKNGTLYRLSLINDNIVVCLCTPLMQRTVQQLSEILIIDSSSVEVKDYKMYFILTQASVGALPIACIISNNSSLETFSVGMKLFNEMVQIQPSVILTSAEIMQEMLEQKFYPAAKFLLSFYHTLKSCWKYLHDARHEIAKGKKESYYQLFRDVVFSDTEETLVVSRQVLAVECAQQKFLDYVDKMYENIALWCLFYREYFLIRGVETFNFNEAETSFRLFRLFSEVPIDRTKHFTVTQIVDFMCSAFEKFYKNRILEMVLNQDSKVLQERYFKKLVVGELQMEDIGHHQYLFKALKRDAPEAYYQVDMITNFCTCAAGLAGKFCEHISEVLLRCNIFTPLLSVEQKAAYYFVATGVLKHKNSFLPDQANNLGEEYNIISCSPETILGPEFDEADNGLLWQENKTEVFTNFQSTKNKWIAYCNQVIQHMENDPARFLPAINAHLDNVQKYSTSIPLLLKGLYAGFPYKGDAEKLPPLAIIPNKLINTGQNREPPPLTPCATKLTLNNTNKKQLELYNKIGSIKKSLDVIKQNENKQQIKPPMKRIKRSNSSFTFEEHNIAESSWNNYNSRSNSPSSLEFSVVNSSFSGDEPKDIQILDTKTEALRLKESSVRHLIHNMDVSFESSSNDKEESPKSINFSVDPAQLEDISQSGATFFEIQGSLKDLAVLNEKKGIIIIPMPD